MQAAVKTLLLKREKVYDTVFMSDDSPYRKHLVEFDSDELSSLTRKKFVEQAGENFEKSAVLLMQHDLSQPCDDEDEAKRLSKLPCAIVFRMYYLCAIGNEINEYLNDEAAELDQEDERVDILLESGARFEDTALNVLNEAREIIVTAREEEREEPPAAKRARSENEFGKKLALLEFSDDF